jgi:hypothetical protein
MALELVATVAGAWLWENYGKEWVGSLGGGAKDKWTGFHETRRWKQAAQAYREALFRDHATIRV